MADPLSVTTGALALATFAFTSSLKLYTTIRDFRSQDKRVRALKGELSDLTAVLQSLVETVSLNPSIDFKALELPLRRCGKACEEYGELIARFSGPATEQRSKIGDWITRKYLQGDITDFKDMLAVYKATINIALANANIRVAAITPNVLEEYKDMILDTTQDLQDHLKKLDAKIQALSHESDTDSRGDNERQAMIEEKRSTQQGLNICAQLSARIEELEPTDNGPSLSSNQPLAHEYIKTGLNATKASIQTLVSQLRTHENNLNERMKFMSLSTPLSKETTTEVMQLQETKDSIQQCIKIISDADTDVAQERHNVFEDITLADEAYNFTISTVGDLVTARRINLTGRSRNIGGQISNESYQKTIDAFTKEAIEISEPYVYNSRDNTSPDMTLSKQTDFNSRHGHGVKLSEPRSATRPRE